MYGGQPITRAVAPADNCTCICKFFSGPFGTFYCFANAHFIVNSRWTSEHFSIVEIVFSPATIPNPLAQKSMRTLTKLTIILLCISTRLQGQESEIDRLIQSELKITFPSIHFKHNSTDYASMPYSVDSCFKYISLHFDDNINSLVIWRDSNETEGLTIKRIKKLKLALNKYLRAKEFEIYAMGNEQKVSRHAINMTTDSSKIKYLLTLNSVFDISKSRLPFKTKKSHILHPKIWCGNCWKNGFHLNKRGREIRKMARSNKHNTQKGAKQ